MKDIPATPLANRGGVDNTLDLPLPNGFKSVALPELPLGFHPTLGYEPLFPRREIVMRASETVENLEAARHPVSMIHPSGVNRLFWGDSLDVMRQIPSESLDLIYLDPPFFSGRNYQVMLGDGNEARSFSDVWQGGMPGYLVWLNARLWEMKRLLKPTGSIYVHVDWHAVHYIKVEMDKLFGYDRFINEIIWKYSQGGKSKYHWARKHDNILFYSKTPDYYFDPSTVRTGFTPHKRSTTGSYGGRMGIDEEGRPYVEKWGTGRKKLYRYYLDEGKIPEDVWEIQSIQSAARERIGYPTQKPEQLLEWIIRASCPEDGVVADFFCGGGTTCAVAQKLGRPWLAADISQMAVSVTAERLSRELILSDVNKPPIEGLSMVPEDECPTSNRFVSAETRGKVQASAVAQPGFSIEICMPDGDGMLKEVSVVEHKG